MAGDQGTKLGVSATQIDQIAASANAKVGFADGLCGGQGLALIALSSPLSTVPSVRSRRE